MRTWVLCCLVSLVSVTHSQAAEDYHPVVIAEHALLCGSVEWLGSNFERDSGDMQIAMARDDGSVLAVVPARAFALLPKVCQERERRIEARSGSAVAYFGFVAQTINEGNNTVRTLDISPGTRVRLSCNYRGRTTHCKSHSNSETFRVPSVAALYVPGTRNANAAGSLMAMQAPITFAGPIAYVTDRKPDAAVPSASGGFFLNDRPQTTIAGCNSHLTTGTASADDCYLSYGIIDADNTVSPIKGTGTKSAVEELYGEIAAKYQGFKQIVIYIPGFNHSFAQALEDARDLSDELNDPGKGHKAPTPVLIYSWPTKAADYIIPVSLLRYPDDETNNSWATLHFSEFLRAFLDADQTTNAPTVHLIAHSMGNRLMLSALLALRQVGTYSGRIGQVVSFEPDVDQQTYAETMALVGDFVKGIVLYGSANDLALRGSRFLHQHCRAGQLQCGDAFFPATVNVIDATPLRNCDAPAHHSYWPISATVLAELDDVLGNNAFDPARLKLTLSTEPLATSNPSPFPHYLMPASASNDCG